MIVAAILFTAAILLAGLLQAEAHGAPSRILPFKTPLSMLFVAAWFLHVPRYPAFADLILAALICCLLGDILLAFQARRMFLLGLISFLTGHVIYAAAFFLVGSTGAWMAMGMIVLAASGGVVWRWLAPRLDEMALPVLAYIVVISIMAVGAFSVAGNAAIPAPVRFSVLCGAVLFYLSDMFVARQRFVVNAAINRRAGLPLYYSAQFLLALSAAWLPAS